jgi:hypothetical protein
MFVPSLSWYKRSFTYTHKWLKKIGFAHQNWVENRLEVVECVRMDGATVDDVGVAERV